MLSFLKQRNYWFAKIFLCLFALTLLGENLQIWHFLFHIKNGVKQLSRQWTFYKSTFIKIHMRKCKVFYSKEMADLQILKWLFAMSKMDENRQP